MYTLHPSSSSPLSPVPPLTLSTPHPLQADSSSGMLLRLRFLIFKNLGSIARSHGDNSAAVDAYIQVAPLYTLATIHGLITFSMCSPPPTLSSPTLLLLPPSLLLLPQAVGVDGNDVTAWYQLAQASCSLGNLLLGRTALEEVSESMSSVHVCMIVRIRKIIFFVCFYV